MILPAENIVSSVHPFTETIRTKEFWLRCLAQSGYSFTRLRTNPFSLDWVHEHNYGPTGLRVSDWQTGEKKPAVLNERDWLMVASYHPATESLQVIMGGTKYIGCAFHYNAVLWTSPLSIWVS